MSINDSVNSAMWSTTYLALSNKHDLAFKAIEEAISLEERESPGEAIEKYKEGISLIDEALKISVPEPENSDAAWDKSCSMVQKMKRTRAEVLTRINCIQSAPEFSSSLQQPPSYEEAMSSVSTSGDESSQYQQITYNDLATALQELSVDPNQHLNEELVYSHPEVRLYFISPHGEVLSAREPEILKISLLEGSSNTLKAILQIGDWIYPLVPGVSPCYRTDYGAFILPNVYSDVPGSSVGIILPSDADADVFELLESILHGIVTQETEQAIYEEKRRRIEKEDLSTRISHSLINGSWSVSQGIIRGAHKVGEFLNWGTPKLIDSMTPADQPTVVPRSVKKGVKIAETATSKAVQVTGFVAEKVGEGTMRLGQFLAPHIQKQGTKLLSSGFNMSEEKASEKMKSALTIAAGAVEGFSTIYRGLETSAEILGASLKDNTVKVVEHKWGSQCACTTECSINTVGNVYSTYGNTKILRPKGLLKSTAKGAGKEMVMVHSVSRKGNAELLDKLEASPSNITPERPPRKGDLAPLSNGIDKENDEKQTGEKEKK